MKKIYCFGNQDLREDSYALELADELGKDKSLNNKFEFVKCINPDFLLDINDKEIVIIDVVKGINKVEIINNIDKLKETATTTMHDFDLCTVLKLLKETGKLKEIIIIGVPQKSTYNDNKNTHNKKNIKEEKIKNEIINYLFSLNLHL